VCKSKGTCCNFFYTDGVDFNGKRNRFAFFFWFSKKIKKRILNLKHKVFLCVDSGKPTGPTHEKKA
jgi:hypothetical protein